MAEYTFFKIVTIKQGFTASDSFKTWLYTIGRNMAINYMRRAKKISDVPIEDINVSSDECNLEETYIREEQKIVIHRALSKINVDYSKVLYLKFFEDLNNEQIAMVLKKNRRQIENMIYQAKQALKSELDKEGVHYEGL